MTLTTALIRNGQVELPHSLDLPDGTQVVVFLPDREETNIGFGEDPPMTPEEIARILTAMEKIEPLELTEEEEKELASERQARKEREKACFNEHADKLRDMWE